MGVDVVSTDDQQIEKTFDEALRHPSPSYALGAMLARTYRELAMVEVPHGLDAASFAAGNHCTLELRQDCYQQIDTHWTPDDGVFRRPRVAWLKARWKDESFEIVELTWGSGGFGPEQTRTYILGRDRALCEAFVDAVSRWNHEVRGEILVFKDGCFQKSAKLYAAVTASSFDQLILEGTFKQQIVEDFTQFLASRETYEEHGVPWKRGALFIGPPGNGKTLCMKALIRELGIPCIYVQSFESPHSLPQTAMETVFRRARSTAPCLLVLEDIDALLVEGTRSYFLNELDGFATNSGVITLATTNHPERLDPSIVERPSRFDRKYHFDLPTVATRARYIAAWNDRLKPALRLSGEECAQLAERTEGFSFAYIQEVFVSSMMRWMSRRDDGGIQAVALEQVELLRAQMQSAPSESLAPIEPSEFPSMPPWMMRYMPRRR
jgi:SpoVK/Ycf46/Vps4 family AAA+-type ATPase